MSAAEKGFYYRRVKSTGAQMDRHYREYTTAELKISYVRALTPQVERVRAEGRVIHAGRQAGFAEGRLFGPDGRLYAHATTTCIVLSTRAAEG